ncbi:hypothetical protein ACJZ2D_015917 [Fusarium nematophilum]
MAIQNLQVPAHSHLNCNPILITLALQPTISRALGADADPFAGDLPAGALPWLQLALWGWGSDRKRCKQGHGESRELHFERAVIEETHFTPGNKTPIRLDFFDGVTPQGPILETQYRDSSSVDLLDTAPSRLREGSRPAVLVQGYFDLDAFIRRRPLEAVHGRSPCGSGIWSSYRMIPSRRLSSWQAGAMTVVVPGTRRRVGERGLRPAVDGTPRQTGWAPPVELPWADEVDVLLQAWYGGQEGGNAIADALALRGPSFAGNDKTWPGLAGVVHYEEGTHVGYRWYAHAREEPQWWFRYGLSYSQFESELLSVDQGQDGWTVRASMRNVSGPSGAEVVQFYAWPDGREDELGLVSFNKLPVLQRDEVAAVALDV